MEILTMIVSSSLYGDERTWNALRPAKALICSNAKMRMNILLIGDAVNAAKKGQKPAKGLYNIEKMLVDLTKVGAKVSVCHTSMNLRGLTEQDDRGNQDWYDNRAFQWIEESERVLSF